MIKIQKRKTASKWFCWVRCFYLVDELDVIGKERSIRFIVTLLDIDSMQKIIIKVNQNVILFFGPVSSVKNSFL